MKKIIASMLALLAINACATDPEYSFREGVRSQVQSNIYSVAVAFPGNATIASNLTAASVKATGTLIATNGTTTLSRIDVGAANNRITTSGNALDIYWYDGIKLHSYNVSAANGIIIDAYGSMTLPTNLVVNGDATLARTPAIAANPDAAPTNSASRGLTLTINGTNYIVALFPN